MRVTHRPLHVPQVDSFRGDPEDTREENRVCTPCAVGSCPAQEHARRNGGDLEGMPATRRQSVPVR